MKPILWMVMGLLVAGGIVFVSALRTRRHLPVLPEGMSLPPTPVQRYARLALSGVLLLTLAAGIWVTVVGPQTWWDNDTVRRGVTGTLLLALLVFAGFMATVRSLESRDDGSFDERDQAILGRACAGVGGAMMAVLAAWMIGLVETFNDTRLVPSYFLYLMFWSCVMTNVVASLAGILVAYKRD